jgi:hypothetical protein
MPFVARCRRPSTFGYRETAARIAAWWLDVHPPGEAFVVSTAPTFSQVRAILWREIGRAHRKGGLPRGWPRSAAPIPTELQQPELRQRCPGGPLASAKQDMDAAGAEQPMSLGIYRFRGHFDHPSRTW